MHRSHSCADSRAFYLAYAHLDLLPVAEIICNKAAARKLKYIMFLIFQVKHKPTVSVRGVYACTYACARARGDCFIVTEFQQSSCGKNAYDERRDTSPACKQGSDTAEQAAAQTAPGYKKISFIARASCPSTFLLLPVFPVCIFW